MSLPALSDLDVHKISAPFGVGYPDNLRVFYSPVDQVHDALLDLVNSAEKSVVLAMYGYDDDQLHEAILRHLQNPQILVQLTLDSSQAAGKHEAALLEHAALPGNSVAIGRSEKGAIMHLKTLVIDGLDTVTGSTNWSQGGENDQDNEMTVIRSVEHALEASTRISMIHSFILKAAAAKAATLPAATE